MRDTIDQQDYERGYEEILQRYYWVAHYYNCDYLYGKEFYEAEEELKAFINNASETVLGKKFKSSFFYSFGDWEDEQSFGTYSTFTVANSVKKQLLEDDQKTDENTFVVAVNVLTEPIELQTIYSRHYTTLSGDRFYFEVETTVDRVNPSMEEASAHARDLKSRDGVTVSAYGTDYDKVRDLFEKTMKEL